MSLDLAALARALLSQSRELLPTWLPGGEWVGPRFVVGELNGSAGHSICINADTGTWLDVRDPTSGGGDLVSLYAAIYGLSERGAAVRLGADERIVALPDAIEPPPNGHATGAPAQVIPIKRKAPRKPVASRTELAAFEDGGQTARALPRSRDLPTIEYRAGELSRIVCEAQDALLEQNAGIYQRASHLVRVARLDRDVIIGGVARAAGSAIIIPCSVAFLTLTLARCAHWVQYDGRSQGLRTVDPPTPISATLLAMVGEWRVPILKGLIMAPTLRADGSLLDQPGYDVASGLYGAFRPEHFPAINPNPTEDDACEALKVLDDLFCEFDFLLTDEERLAGKISIESPHSSVAIAALMTAATRSAVPMAPATGIDAAKAGSGKTTLAKVICYVVTGHDPPVLTLAQDEAEFKKCLLAILMAGDACILIDNVDKPVDSASLCAVLTSATYSERLLGVNQRVEVPSTVTWLLTGNHLEFVGDLTSRVMLSVLDPQEERPESRMFKRDIMDYVLQHRGTLLAATLTVALAYCVAGKPKGSESPSRFSAWDTLVRRPLLWLKRADPLATQADVRDVDPVREALLAVLNGWRQLFGDNPGTVKEALNRVAGNQVLYPEAKEAFLAVAGDRNGEIGAKRLGRYLMRSIRRIEGGLRLNQAGMDPLSHSRLFFVTEVKRH